VCVEVFVTVEVSSVAMYLFKISAEVSMARLSKTAGRMDNPRATPSRLMTAGSDRDTYPNPMDAGAKLDTVSTAFLVPDTVVRCSLGSHDLQARGTSFVRDSVERRFIVGQPQLPAETF
jgi:hypothetical protein